MKVLTTTIQRRPFVSILAGIKKIEYREMKPYWDERLAEYAPPFDLRLINGMSKKAPEITVRVTKITKNTRQKVYELHLGKVKHVKNWDIEKRLVQILSITGTRDWKVAEYTKRFELLCKKKSIWSVKKSANVQKDYERIEKKLAGLLDQGQ